MVLTGSNDAEGILQALAKPLASEALPFLSVFVGALGSFLSGSATVSNLLFGPIQVQAAGQLGIMSTWILALQLVGAGVGNMVALPNILAVEAAVGAPHEESSLLRHLAIPCLLYLAIAGMIGLLFVRYAG